MSAEVAIAVVSWNTRELLARCLESVRPEVERGRATVHVVDNASGDGSAEMVRERFDWAELIACEENLGFGRAVNLAAERSESAWIAPANADVALTPGALDRLLAAADPSTAALAPRLVLPSGETQHSVYAFPSLGFLFLFNFAAYRIVPGLGDRLCLEGYWDPARPRTVDWAIGAFLLVRRDAWERVGGFDPEQWMYAEDLDLGWRLARAGYRTRYVPEAVVEHESAAATRQAWGADAAPRWLESTYEWMRRRAGRPYARAAALLNLLGAAFRLGGFTVVAALRGGAWVTRRDRMRRWARLHLTGLRG